MAHTDPKAHGTPPGVGHEQTDVDLSGANRFIIIMVVLLAVSFGFVYFVFTKWRGDYLASQPQPSPVAARAGDRLPPLPRLQTTPYVDLKAFQASEDEVLTTYAWVDKEKGVVRLPIDEAIALVAERGLPPAGPAPDKAPAPDAGAAPAAPAAAPR
jgi:hypothetical protein